MANKIVIYHKGSSDGAEYPLDADVGTDGKGILWMGGSLFMVSILQDIKQYLLDRASSIAIYQDRTIASGMSSVQSLTGDGRILWPFGQISSGGRIIYGWRPKDYSGNLTLDLQTANFATIPAGYGNRDTSFNGDLMFHQTHPGSGSVNFRASRRMVNESPVFASASGNTLAETKGLTISRDGEGFWWATTVAAVNQVQFVSFATKDFTGDPITLNNAGTMRCMDDCGPFLAFIYN